jgi:hypothetical protein
MAGDLALSGRHPLLEATKGTEVVVAHHSTQPSPLRNPEPAAKDLASGFLRRSASL